MDTPASPAISVILPAKNEAEGLRRTLPGLRELLADAEVIVVDDAGHSIQGDRPVELARLLDGFVPRP